MEYSRRRPLPLALAATARALLASTRPKQWTKNLIIFFALFFTISDWWDLNDLGRMASLAGRSTAAFALFSALSGAVYLVNDVIDVGQDRRHPLKRLRPIAAGQLSAGTAWAAAAVLAGAALVLSLALEPVFGLVSLLYLSIMLAYSLALKRVVLLDVFSISGGFVLRAVAGAAVLQVPISPWLYICTGLGALFIALAKRRSELAAAGAEAGKQRESLQHYSRAFLDQLMAVVAPSTLITYSLYTFTAPNLPDNHFMMFTIPLVAYGLFRYMYLVHTERLGESPEDIVITDLPLVVSILLWLAVATTILVVYRA